MRYFLPGDLWAAASVLWQAAPDDPQAMVARLLAEANAAHRYMRRFGRPHPRWGNGSLMSRCLQGGGRLHGAVADTGFLEALGRVAEVVVAERRFRAARGGRR